MNHIRARIPAGIDFRDTPPEADFNTLEELLAVDFVARRTLNKSFKRFSVAGRGSSPPMLLIAEMLDGTHWGVGYLTHDVPELPEVSMDNA